MSPLGSAATPSSTAVREHLRRAGMRWTPQRGLLLEVLESTDGHVTGSELVDRLRALDPQTTPSTVYRTLRVLEEIGVVEHAHGADGREEFHVRPAESHGHLHCSTCGRSWEISHADAAATVREFSDRFGFEIDLSHLSVGGRCAGCSALRA
jgi:Fur family transcriptional regulator, ferric uptake regulator